MRNYWSNNLVEGGDETIPYRSIGLRRIRGHSRSQPSSKFHVYVMTDARRMRAAEVKLAVFLRRAILSSKTQIELSGRGS
jgi:hypothetical protein